MLQQSNCRLPACEGQSVMRECVSYGYEVLDCQQHTSRSMGSQFADTIFSTGGEGATTVSAGEEETAAGTS